jgi:hypothetical protein
MLIELVNTHGTKNWKKISDNLNSRNPVQCLHRWTKILKPGLKKGPWTIEEDRSLLEWIKAEGPCKWSQCADFIQGRSGKQCRERWFNTLNPNVKKGGWTAEEDYAIFKNFAQSGSKWSKIAEYLPGRTENSIKNRFYSTLRRIASDSKKSSTYGGEIQKSEKLSVSCTETSTPLVDLLKFFPKALEEKTQAYTSASKSKNENSNFSSKNSNSHNKSHTDNNQNKINKNNFIVNKKSAKGGFKSPVTNINNTFNFNVNFGRGNNNNNLPKQSEDISDLESVIEDFCCDDLTFKDSKLLKIENNINNLLTNYKSSQNNPQMSFLPQMLDEFNNNNNNNTQQHVNSNSNSNTNNGNSLINLLNQLSELEQVLQSAKKDIYDLEKSRTITTSPNVNDCIQLANMQNVNTFGNNVNYMNAVNQVNNAYNHNNNNNNNNTLVHTNPFFNEHLQLNNPLNKSLHQSIDSSMTNFYSDDPNAFYIEHMFKF